MLASEGQEVGGLAGATIVVPDSDTRAHQGVLGVEIGLEGVVVDAPVAVDGGLVTGGRGGSDVGFELGLADGREAGVAGLPGLELNARHGESSVSGHGSEGQRGGGDEGLYHSLSIHSIVLKEASDDSHAHLGEVHLAARLVCVLRARLYRKAGLSGRSGCRVASKEFLQDASGAVAFK